MIRRLLSTLALLVGLVVPAAAQQTIGISGLPVATSVNPQTDYGLGIVSQVINGQSTYVTMKVPLSKLVGPQGAPAYLSGIIVTTLPAGSQATGSISGAPPNYVLNLGLPQGPAGTPSLSGSFTPGDLVLAGSATGFTLVDGGAPGAAAFKPLAFFLQTANNLSDVPSAATARGNLSAAKSGANSDITGLAGLTTPLSAGQGGTGAGTLSGGFDASFGSTQGGVLYRSATGWVLLAPGAAGQVLVTGGPSANPAWAPAGQGTVSNVATGPGLVGGPITTTGTISDATYPMQERLTLASGTPVMASAMSGAGTVYMTPYHGRLVSVWNGSDFVAAAFTEYGQALTDTAYSPSAAVAGACYDDFAWNSAGTVRATRGPSWAAGATAGSTTARGQGAGSTALTTVNGILVNQYAITNGPAAGYGTYLGTFCTDAGSATVTWNLGGSAAGGTASVLNLWNMWNRVNVRGKSVDTNNAAVVSTTYVSFDGAGNRATFVTGWAEEPARVTVSAMIQVPSVSGTFAYLGAGLDSVTASTGFAGSVSNNSTAALLLSTQGFVDEYAGLGQHYVQAVVKTDGNSYTYQQVTTEFQGRQ